MLLLFQCVIVETFHFVIVRVKIVCNPFLLIDILHGIHFTGKLKLLEIVRTIIVHNNEMRIL